MKWPDTNALTLQSAAFVQDMTASLRAMPSIALSSLPAQETALFLVDMVNGFAREGALASERVGALVEPVASLTASCAAAGIPVVAFADSHTTDSLELRSYPPHCLRGTAESALCDEIADAAAGGITRIDKNSTNGFLEPVFELWRRDHAHIRTWIVAGDCTDICVQQFVLAALAWHNTRNLPLRILLPVELIDTFDAPGHPADVLNLAALYFMRAAGAELCTNIT